MHERAGRGRVAAVDSSTPPSSGPNLAQLATKVVRRVPREAFELCEHLRAAGFRAWLVGGAVRDALLERTAGDWDVATDAQPRDVMGVFKHVIPTGIAHGTVTVRYKDASYEVTALRGEGAYSDGRRPDAVYPVDSIEADLARRDFTVNALAFDPVARALIDPYQGTSDLERRVLRTVGDPVQRFTEDGLRVLRAARFAATLEFDVAPETERAIAVALVTYRAVSRERVHDEWLKCMAARRPSRAFEIMRRTGILSVTCPPLLEMVGCTQNRFHAYDVWEHTMRCLDAAPVDPAIRLAALFHDVGKPAARGTSDKTGDVTFYNHEKVGAELADAWLREYRFSNTLRELVVHLIANHLVVYSDDWSDAAVRRFVRRVGVDNVTLLTALARADALAKGRPVEEELALLTRLESRVKAELAKGATLSLNDLAIDGNDLIQELGLAPSKRIGELLRELLELVTEHPECNERTQLLDAARAMVARSEA